MRRKRKEKYREKDGECIESDEEDDRARRGGIEGRVEARDV